MTLTGRLCTEVIVTSVDDGKREGHGDEGDSGHVFLTYTVKCGAPDG